MPSPRAAESQTVQLFEKTVTRTIGYRYLLALPSDYGRRTDRRWPLILFLHGAGERGDDVWSVANHGPPKLVATKSTSAKAKSKAKDPARTSAALIEETFIVVSPQCPKNKWWDTETLAALLDEIMVKYAVDPERVYLTGLSMGGYGAWALGTAYPERFAAVVPICGGGEFGTLFMSDVLKRDALRSLPVWAFHGARDEAVPVVESQRMIDALKHYQVKEVKFTVYPDAAHDSWSETYANPELYAWLLRHRRKGAASVP